MYKLKLYLQRENISRELHYLQLDNSVRYIYIS